MQPHYLFNGGLRVDFEKQIKPKQWLLASVKGYYLPHTDFDDDTWWSFFTDNSYGDITGLNGFGIELGYKRTLLPRTDILYLSGGLSYGYFDGQYYGTKYISYIENGLTFDEPRFGEINQYFNRLGANACFGIQTQPKHRFCVDGYIGIGYNYSFYNKNKQAFDEEMYTAGYRGLSLITGIRLGFRLGKVNK